MNKKVFALIMLFVGACIVAVFLISINNRSVQFCMDDDGFIEISVHVNSYKEIIKPYYCERDDTYYFFMPSVICDKKIYNDIENNEFIINQKKLNKYGVFEWGNGEVNKFVFSDKEVKVVFMESSDIATLFITTDTGDMENLNADKKNIEHGKVDIIEPNGTLSYSGGLSLTGRGNSTFKMFDKKPFNIKLDDSAGILGMESNKDWCLLANSWDYSYMNNKLAFDMASMAGFAYVPDAEYADVYFNGEYWGIYLVTEKVEVDDKRIDITDLKRKNQDVNPQVDITLAEKFDNGDTRGVILDNQPNDISGGYLLEKDYRLNAERYGEDRFVMTTSYFETYDYGTSINIKSPEYATEDELNYIRQLTSEMEYAILASDGYSKEGKYYLDYIDLDSWVKWYMIAEIAYDLDKDGTNTYFYKDIDEKNTHFYMGPVWDYDCRFGGTYQYPSPEI